MNKLGIIPAAGMGRRFGGAFKELLPISNNETLLSRTLTFLTDIPVDHSLIITSANKYAAHALTADRFGALLVQQMYRERDAWDAICESFAYAGDMNYYLQPDTYIPARSNIGEIPEGDFIMGLFTTARPERFGVLFDGAIHDKQDSFRGSIQIAWGLLAWSGAVVEFWKRHNEHILTQTQAFNMAIKEFGYNTFKLPFYYDVSCFEDYKRLLEHV